MLYKPEQLPFPFMGENYDETLAEKLDFKELGKWIARLLKNYKYYHSLDGHSHALYYPNRVMSFYRLEPGFRKDFYAIEILLCNSKKHCYINVELLYKECKKEYPLLP